MSAEEIALRLFFGMLETMLAVFGPAFVRDRTIKRIDEWEAARMASDAAFRAKYGEDP